MKIVALAGSVVGKKTLTVMNYVAQKMATDFSEIDFELIELAKKDIQFSDGRNYLEYSGDTLEVTTKIMAADALIIGSQSYFSSCYPRFRQKYFWPPTWKSP